MICVGAPVGPGLPFGRETMHALPDPADPAQAVIQNVPFFIDGLNFGDLSSGDLKPVIPCDKVQFRFLGITLAGYNFLISAAIVVLLLAAVVAQLRRKAT